MEHTAKALERYIGGLIIGQGRHAGQPFKVLTWRCTLNAQAMPARCACNGSARWAPG